jgi:hypothetical protein
VLDDKLILDVCPPDALIRITTTTPAAPMYMSSSATMLSPSE